MTSQPITSLSSWTYFVDRERLLTHSTVERANRWVSISRRMRSTQLLGSPSPTVLLVSTKCTNPSQFFHEKWWEFCMYVFSVGGTVLSSWRKLRNPGGRLHHNHHSHAHPHRCLALHPVPTSSLPLTSVPRRSIAAHVHSLWISSPGRPLKQLPKLHAPW